MGVVFRATQVSLGRTVALKVLPSHISLNQGALKRFQREAITAGRLNHPGIAKVYMVGNDRDLHYFAMELVEGPSLEACILKLRGREAGQLRAPLHVEAGNEAGTFVPPSPRSPFFAASAAWGAEVADALAAAHKERVLHRDLKPSNIILRPNASPVLVDFGLSQDRMDTTGITKTGDAIGTPAYMSPEQARGERELDERCDVYGLGATLYELVTLRPPFEGKHPTQVMRRILDEDVVDPCRINRNCPRDLANVILKCLAKKREDRYCSASALAVDLRNFLRGDTVEAKSPGAGFALRRLLGRRKRVLLGTAAGVVLTLVGTGGTIWFRAGFEREGAQSTFGAALEHLRDGKTEAAANLFMDARQVLGDEAIKAKWVESVRKRAQDLTDKGRHAAAEKMLGRCLMLYMQESQTKHWIAMARGSGTLVVDVAPPEATVRVLGWSDDTQQFSKRVAYKAGVALPCRVYIVAAEAPGHVTAKTIVALTRDQQTKLKLRALPELDLLPGTAYVSGDGRGMPPFLIDETEVTCAKYQEFLAPLSAAQRAEIQPRDWPPDSGPPAEVLNTPVRNVPVAGAQAFARWRGGHLPSVDEFRVAGSLGGPWAWPWGPSFDSTLLVADSTQRTAPDRVGSKPLGASHSGALDLVGNVAELVTGTGGALFAQAGGYHAPEDALRLDRGRPVGQTRGSPDIGFRLAYCLSAPDDDGPGKTEATWNQRKKAGVGQVRSVVTFGEDGRIELLQEVTGAVQGVHLVPDLFQLPGGRGHFSQLDAEIEGPPGLSLTPEAPDIAYHLFKPDMKRVFERSGRRYAFSIRRGLLAKQIVFPVGANRYVHRFHVIRRLGEAQYHRLVLSGKARVLASSIPPTDVRIVHGETVVTFEFPPRKTGWPAVEPVEVEFAVDSRGAPLPARANVEKTLQDFCDVWKGGLAGPEARFVDDGFTFGPRAVRKVQLRSSMRLARRITEQAVRQQAQPFEYRLDSVGAISGMGSILRVEVAMLSSRDGFAAPHPMIFTLVHRENERHVIDLSGPIQVDTSVHSKDQVRNEALGFSVPLTKKFIACRLSRFDAPMQVRLDYTDIYSVEDPLGKKHTPSLALYLFAANLAPDQTEQQLVNSLLRDSYPLHVTEHVESGESPIGPQRVKAHWSKLFLSQPWKGGDPGRLQKRYVFQRGRTVFCIVAECHGAPRDVLEYIFKQRFDGTVDALLRQMRL